MIKKIINITPLITGLLIFFGFLKVYFYYGYFEVDIKSYLEFSELILLFLDDVNLILLFFLIGILHFFGLTRLIESIDASVKKNNLEIDLNQKSETIEDFIVPKSNTGIVLVFIVFIVFSVGFSLLYIYYVNYVFLYLAIITIFQLLLFIFDFILDNIETNLIFSAIISSTLFVIGITYYAKNEITNKTKEVNYKFEFDEKLITTNENYYMIGMTNHYLFINNDKENKVDVFLKEEIKHLTIYRN